LYVDPLGDACLGSPLLLVVDKRQAEKFCRFWKKERMEYSVIGKVVPREKGVKIVEGKKESNLFESNQDELSKVL